MHAIFADLRRELAEVRAEQELLSRAAERFAADLRGGDDVLRWLTAAGIASGLEKVFSGCERVLRIVASEIDGHSPQSDDWHAALLRRMAAPLPGARPAVLEPDNFAALDELRAFRHRERNSYTVHLRGDRLLELVVRSAGAVDGLSRDIDRLEAALGAS